MDPGELFDVITVKTEASDDTQMTEKWLNDLAKKKRYIITLVRLRRRRRKYLLRSYP